MLCLLAIPVGCSLSKTNPYFISFFFFFFSFLFLKRREEGTDGDNNNNNDNRSSRICNYIRTKILRYNQGKRVRGRERKREMIMNKEGTMVDR